MIPISNPKPLSIMMLTFLLTTGCGLLQKSRPHYNSCGPDAVFYAFRWHGIESSRYKISKEILKDHKAYSLLRDTLSVFNAGLGELTFPKEIKDELEKYKIKVHSASLGEFKKLKKDKDTTAIVLVRPKGGLKYHWLFYPTQSDSPSSYFGSLTTVVDKIYTLTRTNID